MNVPARIATWCLAGVLAACAPGPRDAADIPGMIDQPALAQLAVPYAGWLQQAGISRVASPGDGALVRLVTAWGPVYVRYPAGLPPFAFVLDVDTGRVRALATTLDPALATQVFAALIPDALRVTAANNDFEWRRANPLR